MNNESPQLYLGLSTDNWVVIGGSILAVVVVLLVYYLNGFRPKASTKIDGRGQRIKVTIRNSGRADGHIDSVSFIKHNRHGKEIAQCYSWHGTGNYSATLPGNGTIQFVAQITEGSFVDGTLVRVIANGKQKDMRPKRMPSNISWHLNDVLPRPPDTKS